MLLRIEWILLIIFLGHIRVVHFKEHLTKWYGRFMHNFFFFRQKSFYRVSVK